MNYVTGSKASIFVRKTLQVRLRDRAGGKLGGKDLRFSMKMMFAPVMELGYSLTQAAAGNILALIRRKI